MRSRVCVPKFKHTPADLNEARGCLMHTYQKDRHNRCRNVPELMTNN
jgi:hypothetical protein